MPSRYRRQRDKRVDTSKKVGLRCRLDKLTVWQADSYLRDRGTSYAEATPEEREQGRTPREDVPSYVSARQHAAGSGPMRVEATYLY